MGKVVPRGVTAGGKRDGQARGRTMSEREGRQCCSRRTQQRRRRYSTEAGATSEPIQLRPHSCASWHENPGLGGSVRPRAYGRVIRDRGLLGERSRQAVLDDGLRARAFRWPPLRLARIVPRARIGLCRSPAASPVFVYS